MSVFEWLGRWEPIEAPGRHSKRLPADDAAGYQYGPMPWEGVSRAIQAEGRVGPSWERSPQVKFWMEKEKPTILARIVGWLREPAKQ